MIGMQRTRFNHVDLVVESRAAHALQQRRPIKIEVSSCDQVELVMRSFRPVHVNRSVHRPWRGKCCLQVSKFLFTY